MYGKLYCCFGDKMNEKAEMKNVWVSERENVCELRKIRSEKNHFSFFIVELVRYYRQPKNSKLIWMALLLNLLAPCLFFKLMLIRGLIQHLASNMRPANLIFLGLDDLKLWTLCGPQRHISIQCCP